MTDYQKFAAQFAEAYIIDVEIINQTIKELLPEEIGQLIFRAVNIRTRNKGMRHRAFNASQMRRYGFSRIN